MTAHVDAATGYVAIKRGEIATGAAMIAIALETPHGISQRSSTPTTGYWSSPGCISDKRTPRWTSRRKPGTTTSCSSKPGPSVIRNSLRSESKPRQDWHGWGRWRTGPEAEGWVARQAQLHDVAVRFERGDLIVVRPSVPVRRSTRHVGFVVDLIPIGDVPSLGVDVKHEPVSHHCRPLPPLDFHFDVE